MAVALSALLPSICDTEWLERAQFESYYDQVAPEGSLPATAMLAQVDREFGQFAPLLKLANPAKTLLGRYQEAAATH